MVDTELSVVESMVGAYTLCWCPQLVAHLRVAASFRKRTSNLLLVLRNRAIAWCRDNGLDDLAAADIIAGSVAMAFPIGPREKAALLHLRSEEVRMSVEQTDRLTSGRSFWPVAASLMSWLRGRCGFFEAVDADRLWLTTPDVALPTT